MKGSSKVSFTAGERVPDNEISYGDSELSAKPHHLKAAQLQTKERSFTPKSGKGY